MTQQNITFDFARNRVRDSGSELMKCHFNRFNTILDPNDFHCKEDTAQKQFFSEYLCVLQKKKPDGPEISDNKVTD